MIIEEHKTIFIHIPKNAGTAIETLFGNSSFRIQPDKHANIHEIKKKFPKVYDSYRKFTIIRNPYDKMVSWYFYLKRNLGKSYDIIDFNEWIKDPSQFWHANDPIHFLDSQHTWIDNTVKIIKFENLDKELNEFFGKDIDLPVVNKSNHDHYSTYYNRESLDIIYDRYKEDFKKYNYKKL
tara:strand:+ start:76 stop:615 length:540 start_codon:yes stop_codon:yes gene_type:complete